MENNNQKPQGQQLQIDLSPELAKGVYTNFQIISHSSSEFVIDFVTMLPGIPKASVSSRVVMAPEHAKRLLGALQENIIRYEAEFGKINIPNQQPRTIAPFGVNKGEA
ncbi:DUF3467 domain-containing protein [Prevotella brunnea]|uniref:DUF3467 domain-containing protein n=1 Tax=Prevotella brunnea TaxID=2508867 RepID=A0A5C8GKK3_9BACT|nr:DUF3467 domain-containing protein [Prevotella brunnea]MDR0185902.1 DUF3467 domain-containing protein [Prevotella brunnea]TXJ62626.1 DUF3467 domain-containing protein [Prevotella brunnea]